ELREITDAALAAENEPVRRPLSVNAVNDSLVWAIGFVKRRFVFGREQRIVDQVCGVGEEVIRKPVADYGSLEGKGGQTVWDGIVHRECGSVIVVPQVAFGGDWLVSHVVATPAVIHEALSELVGGPGGDDVRV